MATHRRVDFTISVRAGPDRVYDALTTAKGLDAWFTKGATVEAVAGGSIWFRWENWGSHAYSGENGGLVLEARRPNRFAFRWKVDSGAYETTVEINLEQRGEETLVRVVEYGFEESPVGMKDLLNRASGWGHVLTLLKFYVEHGLRG